MPRVNTPYGPVHVQDTGAGDAFLLLPANPGTHRDFDAIVPELSRRHRVVAVDWPGFGDSPAPEPPEAASAMHFARVARGVVEALDLKRLRVIGNSVGGYAAVRLALECPDRVEALVLVDSGGFTEPTALARAFCWLKGREWITRLVATRFAEHYLRVKNDSAREVLERTELGRKDPRSVAVDAAVWRSFSHPAHDLREDAKHIRVPTLVAWGRQDPVVPLATDGATAHRTIPGAELAVFDTGHMPFVEAPGEFLKVALEFLSRSSRAVNAA
jgi:pimeloyl-ACP methyl ester carboxylesterase